MITTVRIAAAAQINPPYSVQADFALTTTDDGGDLVFALLGYKAVEKFRRNKPQLGCGRKQNS